MKPYAAEHLTHSGDQAELVVDTMASGDAAVIRKAIDIAARARGMDRVAHDAGMVRGALYKALGPDGDPCISTLLGVFARGIGLSASALPPTAADPKIEISAAS